MFYKNKIKLIQVENTSICNAKCPMCLRESTPDDKTWFDETYLETDFYLRIPDDVLMNAENIMFNGVLGDPCAAPNFLEVCKLLKERNPNIRISVSTNGGLRNKEFWKSLALILSTNDRVVFAIDGLIDTNHIYRVNVDFTKVIDNAKAFIDNGGNAEWQFISFKHNQHQIEDARILANQLRFSNFFVKPSHRFVVEELVNGPKFSNGVKLEPPDLDAHPVTFVPKYNVDEWHTLTEHSKISCYAQKTESVYIEYTGRLFPCCPLSAGLMYRRTINFKDSYHDLWLEYGQDKINLKYVDWDNIINGDFFTKVKDSWDKNYSNGRLAPCAGVCSDSKMKFNEKKINGGS